MLIVEDGTGVPDANSYVSVDDLRAFASARGLSVPSSDTEGDLKIEQALISAIDYLETQGGCFAGRRTYPTQSLSWPRSGLKLDGELWPNNKIPKNLKVAQIRLALEVLKGVDLMPTVSGKAEDYVIKEKVGPIETEYADPTKFKGTPVFTAVEALLDALLGESCGGFGSFKVYRA